MRTLILLIFLAGCQSCPCRDERDHADDRGDIWQGPSFEELGALDVWLTHGQKTSRI